MIRSTSSDAVEFRAYVEEIGVVLDFRGGDRD